MCIRDRYAIDWVGWKLVSWDMSMDDIGSWIGDGTLDGNMRFDSFQLKYNQGQSHFGKIYIDDFRIVDNVILSTHEIKINNMKRLEITPENPEGILVDLTAEEISQKETDRAEFQAKQ